MTTRKSDREKHRQDFSESDEISSTGESGENPANVSIKAEIEVEELKKNLAAEKEQAEKYLDQWRRTQADFDNYRRRTEQEKNEISHNTTCFVISNVLTVMDDLERALASIPPEYENLPWVEGVRLIYKKFRAVLESFGLEEVCALGKIFDPSLHEAVAHMEGEEGIVINEVQKGYKLKDKLIRPSSVVVGKGMEKSKEESNN